MDTTPMFHSSFMSTSAQMCQQITTLSGKGQYIYFYLFIYLFPPAGALSLTPPPSSRCFLEREVKENDAVTFTDYYPSQSSMDGGEQAACNSPQQQRCLVADTLCKSSLARLPSPPQHPAFVDVGATGRDSKCLFLYLKLYFGLQDKLVIGCCVSLKRN